MASGGYDSSGHSCCGVGHNLPSAKQSGTIFRGGERPLPSKWPLVGEETFTGVASGWKLGSFPDENLARFDLKIIEGKYRWDMEFLVGKMRWIEAPYGPAVNFYLAVDIKFLAFPKSPVIASLMFGKTSHADYVFSVSSNKTFGLGRFDETRNEMIVEWTPVSVNPELTNRIAVLVEEQKLGLYINSSLLGEYRDSTFAGGKVGLSVTSYQPAVSTVVEFDNFEFRRKP